MGSLHKTTINNKQSNATDKTITHGEWRPYLNWYRSVHSLEFFSPSHEELSHALEKSTQVVIGLSGKESKALLEEHSTDAEASADVLPIDHSLYSNCSSILLKRHCDKIIMNTALVKNRGEKQLFLATEFLSWNDASTKTEQLAPLVMYPVQLFYNDRSNSDTDNFLLYVDTRQAIANQPLLKQVEQQTGQSAPVFEPSDVLKYLLSMAVFLGTSDVFSFQRKVGINVLPSDVEGISGINEQRYRRASDQRLNYNFAHGLIRQSSISDLKSLIRIMEPSLLLAHCKGEHELLPDAMLKENSVSLTSFGLGNISLNHAAELPNKINSWLSDIESIRQKPMIQEWELLSEHQASMYTGLGESLLLIETLSVSNPQYLHGDHAYKSCLPALQRAKFQFRLITSEFESLRAIFNLNELPKQTEIKQLCEVLDDNKSLQTSSVIQPSYFRARKKLSNLLNDHSTNYGETEELQLKRLIKIIHLRDLFVNNEEYRLAFGKLFKGMETDWEQLEGLILFSRKLARKTGSEKLSAHILENWSSFSFGLHDEQSDIKTASRAVKRLINILQIPEDSRTSIDELLVMGKTLKPRLEALEVLHAPSTTVSQLSAQTILCSLEVLEQTRLEYRALETTAEQEAFSEELQTTVSWLYDCSMRKNIKMRDIELLLKRITR